MAKFNRITIYELAMHTSASPGHTLKKKKGNLINSYFCLHFVCFSFALVTYSTLEILVSHSRSVHLEPGQIRSFSTTFEYENKEKKKGIAGFLTVSFTTFFFRSPDYTKNSEVIVLSH